MTKTSGKKNMTEGTMNRKTVIENQITESGSCIKGIKSLKSAKTTSDESFELNTRVGFVNLGCAKNLINTEQMMFLLKQAGFELTYDVEGVDVVVINTCAFIENAKIEAIETILEIGSMKVEGKVGRLVVAGCLAERYKDEVQKEMPEIDAVVGTGAFDSIVTAVNNVLSGEGETSFYCSIDAPVSETERVITTSPLWAYLKVAEGCDNRCAYCVIPDIRGRFRSRPIENIVGEAAGLAKSGTKELILVAQDVTRYGLDMYGERRLPDLLRELCSIDELLWIRLHYLYPDEIDDNLIDVIAEHDKILKYMDIPIQHISDTILKKMHRRGTSEDIRSLIRRLRQRIPGVVLRTSLITGLPGEGEIEFEELCEFLKEAKIERAGVFAYSPEEGTLAAQMDRPDSEIAIHRAEVIAEVQCRIMDEFNNSRVGSVTKVLIEGRIEQGYYARSFAESPDIDGYITVTGNVGSKNEPVDVIITRTDNDGSLNAIAVHCD